MMERFLFMANDKSIFKPFVSFLIICFIVVVLAALFSNLMSGSNYKPNGFLISLNDTKLKFIIKEKYNNKIVKGENNLLISYQDILIIKTDKMILNFQEYEAFDKNNFKTDGSFVNSDTSNRLTYKLIKNDVKIKIKKDGNILYYGNYITDISDYLQEFGRYYIHIYIDRKENSNKISTDLSMTFLLVDKEENYD